MNKSKSDNPFTEIFDKWYELKKEANEKNDWDIYFYYLTLLRKMFNNIFIESKKKDWQKFYGEIIKQVNKEIKITKPKVKKQFNRYKI